MAGSGRPDEASEARERILDVAMRHFGERGLEGASVGRIAADAGVSKALVFFHFGSKQGLADAVRDRFVAACEDELLTTGLASCVPLEQLPELVAAFGRFIGRHPGFVRTFLVWFLRAEGEAPAVTGALRGLLTGFRERIEELVDDGVARGDFRADVDAHAIAHGLMGALEGVVLETRIDRSCAGRAEELCADLAERVLAGIRAHPA